MTHLRSNLLPLEHLLVELTAFPMASVDSLRLGPTELQPLLGEPTGGLWRCAENSILRSYPGVSVDELTTMRDRVWFDLPNRMPRDTDRSIPLHEFLTNLAQSYLRVRGDRAEPCLRWDHGGSQGLEPDSIHKAKSRAAWRWLSFALPEDLLLAALTTEKSAPVLIESLSPQWERTLRDSGFAETHLHLGAALDFRMLWASTMERLREPKLPSEVFASPGAELRDGRDLTLWLLLAAITRCVLAAFLSIPEKWKLPQLGLVDFLAELGLAARPQPANKRSPQELEPMLAELANRLMNTLGFGGDVLLKQTLRWLASGDISPAPSEFHRLRRLYFHVATPSQGSRRSFANAPQMESGAATRRIHRQDPLATWFEFWPRTGTTPEMQFVVRALSYLRTNPTDADFAKLFWQVVRVRNVYFRHIVLRPMTPGLQWFVRTYDRMRAGKHSTLKTQASVASACEVCGLGQGLRSLEVRTAPDEGFQQVISFLEDARSAFATSAAPGGHEQLAEALRRRGRIRGDSFERYFAEQRRLTEDAQRQGRSSLVEPRCQPNSCADAETAPEFGVVLHLVRHRDGGAEEGRAKAHGRTSQADPRGVKAKKDTIIRGGKYRYVGFYSSRLRQVNAVSRALLNFPLSLTVLRGIDACTDELGVPTWTLVPLFRYLHEVGCLVSTDLEQQLGCHVPPLRTTLHAGEDFVHLLGGLRRIDEALRFLGLREGDRLGHAIALGVDATEWAHSASRLAVTREERWLDLIWEWCQYARERQPSPPGRQLLIERELERLTNELLGESLTPVQLELLVEMLHDEEILKHVGFPFGVHKPLGQPSRSFVERALRNLTPESVQIDQLLGLLKRYLTSCNLFDRGREVLWIETDGEAEVLEVLQRGVRERVASRGLCVEINPSSNLLIANLGGIEKRHPLWRLNSPFDPTAEDPIPVCIGSDDPLTFATNLRAEYMLVHDALIASGLSYEVVCQWLDRVRRTGLTYRFTLPQDRAWCGQPLISRYGNIKESRLKPPPGRY